MMPQKQKPLHELLKEDQEPFLLTNFIANRRSLLPKSNFHLIKPKPISHSPDFPSKFCTTACFFSFNANDSQSPLKSPRRNSNSIFLPVPASTAGLLLEAALRIRKHRSKTLNPTSSNGLGFFGSFLKRLTNRRRPRKRRERNDRPGASPLAIHENDSVFQQSNNVKTSSDVCESHFCDSPFRFVLHSSPSPGHRTSEFSSPATSPTPPDHQVNDVESLKKLAVEDEEEEDKEQSSPVSVLDPPFEDDDEGHYEDGEDEDEDEDDYNLERSYAIVQKAKHQLLKKLRRFERLAELDPVELEKSLLKDEEDGFDDDDDIDHLDEEEEYESHNSDLPNNEKDIKQHNIEADGSSSFQIPHGLVKDSKRLVCNLLNEEERDLAVIDKRVCMRPNLWKRVDSNAIDMMVGEDLKAEIDGWNRNGEQKGEIAIEIEFSIFSLLVEEMQSELHCYLRTN